MAATQASRAPSAIHRPQSRGDGSPRWPRGFPTPRRLWRLYKHLTQIGVPARFPIVQFPNLPLAAAFVSGEVAKHTHGSVSAYARAISYLALAVWAYLELTAGVNWFRRLLGLGYSISTAIHLATALQS